MKYKAAVLSIAFLLIFPVTTYAAPKFVTIEEVQILLSTSLAPLQTAVNGLTSRVTTLEDAFAPVPGQISGLQAADATQSGQLASLQISTNAGISQLSTRISGLENRISLIEQSTNDPDFRLTNTQA